MRRQFAALTVAALLLTAGCAGLGGGGGDPNDAGPGLDSDADPLYETPLDANTVVDAHLAGVRDAGTFTLETTNDYGESAPQVLVFRGDLDTGAMYVTARRGDSPFQVYRFGNGTAYERRVEDGETWYDEADNSIDGPSNWVGEGIRGPLDLFEFEYAGTTTEDGATVHVYEADGPSAIDASGGWLDGEETTVESANATLRIRADGVVVHSQYAFTATRGGDTDSVSVTRTYSDLGETDVSPPAWITVARNATG